MKVYINKLGAEVSVIEVKNVYKKYNSFTAINNLSFNVEKGEIFGLLGPNGAGKTTILRIISTILKPDRGEVFVGGYSVRHNPQKVREIIGVCPQEIALYQELSAKDNLVFFGVMGGLDKRQALGKANIALKEFELENKADEKTLNLSGGMKRRLNLAVSVMRSPKVLLLDEPTAGVDPKSRAAIFRILKKFKRSGVSIVYTTHYMHEAERLCDRVAIMDSGNLIALDTPYNLKRVYDSSGSISLEEVFLKLTD